MSDFKKFRREMKHQYTDDVVCPHCLHAHTDSWEFDDNEEDTDCHSCGKAFGMTRNMKVTYCSWKIEK